MVRKNIKLRIIVLLSIISVIVIGALTISFTNQEKSEIASTNAKETTYQAELIFRDYYGDELDSIPFEFTSSQSSVNIPYTFTDEYSDFLAGLNVSISRTPQSDGKTLYGFSVQPQIDQDEYIVDIRPKEGKNTLNIKINMKSKGQLIGTVSKTYPHEYLIEHGYINIGQLIDEQLGRQFGERFSNVMQKSKYEIDEVFNSTEVYGFGTINMGVEFNSTPYSCKIFGKGYGYYNFTVDIIPKPTTLKINKMLANLENNNYTKVLEQNVQTTMYDFINPYVFNYYDYTTPIGSELIYEPSKNLKLNGSDDGVQDDDIQYIYYKRKSYQFTATGTSGISSLSTSGTYKGTDNNPLYQSPVTASFKLLPGYGDLSCTVSPNINVKLNEVSPGNYTYTGIMPAEKLTMNISATIIPYTIDYTMNGGSAQNPTSYNVETNTITLNNPTKVGYTFTGWTGTGLSSPSMSVSIPKGSTGNRSYTANFTPNTDTKYKVQHWQQKLNGNASQFSEENYTLIETENLQGTSDSSVTPNVRSYEGFTSPEAQSVSIKPDGSLVIDLCYIRNNYTVNILNSDGVTETAGSGTHKFGEQVNYSATIANGYDFAAWVDNETSRVVSTEINYQELMPARNLTYIATTNHHNYDIEYDLKGGALKSGDENPTKYNLETETFTLNNPVRNGYIFIGWNLEGTYSINKIVTRERGQLLPTGGNAKYIAMWKQAETVEYTVNNWVQKENGNKDEHNEENYTLLSSDTLYDEPGATVVVKPSKMEEYDAPAEQTIRLDKNTTNVVNFYYTKKDVVKYELSFEVNGGQTIDPIETSKGSNIDLNQYTTTKFGYDFEGWYSDENFQTKITSVTLNEDVIVYAKWNKIEYQITSGANQEYTIGQNSPAVFTSNGKLEDLKDIKVDGKLVESSNYTLKSGSTIVTFANSFMNSLSEGRHTLTFDYTDGGKAETSFVIKRENGSSETGNDTNTNTIANENTIVNENTIANENTITNENTIKQNGSTSNTKNGSKTSTVSSDVAKKDTTTANKKIPQTGEAPTIIAIVALIGFVLVICLRKYNKISKTINGK